MTAPPPMPNRPARMPVAMPPTMMASASQKSSLTGTANISSSCGLRCVQAHVGVQRERLAQHLRAGAGLDGFDREMAAEGARARHAVKQAEHVARDGVQAR